jgi:hypothetical protein
MGMNLRLKTLLLRLVERVMVVLDVNAENVEELRNAHINCAKREPNMPLKKSPSKEAFKQNVKAEVKAGKPVKQAVAIAYAVKKKAK